MQRRAAASSSAQSSLSHSEGVNQINASSHSKYHKTKKGVNPVLFILLLVASILGITWCFFPSQMRSFEGEVEQEAKEMAKNAVFAEHQFEDWFLRQPQQQHNAAPYDKSASDAATSRMMSQKSTWVDGEKALRKQLAKLVEQQEKGENLGVPILTRYLGEDFPAWVTKDMDEKEWRSKVDAEYKRMRHEEQEWQTEMQKIIDQRERDIGLTTA
jgi:sugar diacid utilization regulator